MLGNKKKMKAEAEAKAKEEAQANAEFEAKFAAKQERRKVEKLVAEFDKSCQTLLGKAVEAKAKGQGAIYKTYVTAIKVARARKAQAENFLAQIDAMQEMQSITNSSKELLGSMGTIMGSLGKLTMDRSAVIESQKEFAAVQQSLERQGAGIDSYFSTLSDMLPDGQDDSYAMGEADSDIDAEVNAILRGSASSSGSSSGSSAGSSSSGDLDDLKRMLNS